MKDILNNKKVRHLLLLITVIALIAILFIGLSRTTQDMSQQLVNTIEQEGLEGVTR